MERSISTNISMEGDGGVVCRYFGGEKARPLNDMKK